ncbi:ferric iron reductase, partial [Staphylococcus hominis]|uniref:ferric iron reductase n=1 Tax=Staphylococcus hominis TaxID=1290 RepID=UPI0028CB4B7D
MTVHTYLKSVNHHINQHTIHHFIPNYTPQLVTPLLPLIQHYPIALQPHIQNTLLHLPPNYQIQFILPHLPPSPIHIKTLTQKLNHIQLQNKTLL